MMKTRALAVGLAATAFLGMSVAVASPADAASIRDDSTIVATTPSASGATTQGLDRVLCYLFPTTCNTSAYR